MARSTCRAGTGARCSRDASSYSAGRVCCPRSFAAAWNPAHSGLGAARGRCIVCRSPSCRAVAPTGYSGCRRNRRWRPARRCRQRSRFSARDRHAEPTRARIPALPARPRRVVVPRIERAAATPVDTVQGTSVKSRLLHTTAAAVGVTTVLLLHLGSAGAAGAPSMTARALVVSEQARRYLALAYGSHATQFLGCMIRQVHGPAVFLQRIAPAG